MIVTMMQVSVAKRNRHCRLRRVLLAVAATTTTSVLLFLLTGTKAQEQSHHPHGGAAAEVEIDAALGDVIKPLAEPVVVQSTSTTAQASAWDSHSPAQPKENEQHLNSDSNPLSDVEYDATDHVQCGVWLAPSTIPNAGLGMFAGRKFSAGEPLQEPGDMTVPIVDLSVHSRYFGGPELLLEDYVWTASGMGMGQEGLVEVKAASPGLGSAVNCFLGLVNHVSDFYLTNEDASSLHRSKDPGAGAFTAYTDRRSIPNRDIHAGEELFLDYGSTWFETRPHLGPVPLYKELDLATELFRGWFGMKQDLGQESAKEMNQSGLSDSIALDVWDSFVVKTAFTDSRTIGSFQHANYVSELKRLEESGMTLTQLRQEEATRSEEWLREHGTCIDHMRPGPSTLPQAGRGAFATRFLPARTVVALLPFFHISDRNRLRMHPLTQTDPKHKEYFPLVMTINDDESSVNNERMPQQRPPTLAGMSERSSHKIAGGWQLLLNYCFGHEESKLLLCPYGAMANYINHNQTSANVALRWAQAAHGDSHKLDMLQAPIEVVDSSSMAKLAMELVAIRDITEGEEVFMDYGDAWERAWHEHVQNWKPVSGAEHYQSATMLNQELIVDGTMRLKTEFEQMKDPYPSTVQLHCRESFINHMDKWKEALEMGSTVEYLKSVPLYDFYHACSVLRWKVDSATNETLYTAVAEIPHYVDDTQSAVAYGSSLLVDLPRQAFFFKDRPYTTNMFLENAFRHYIQIPDRMFPEQWKNLKKA